MKPEVLAAANVAGARDIVLAFPNSFEAVAIINAARAANPSIRITARVHSGEQRERLIQAGADTVINGDEVTAQAIANTSSMPDRICRSVTGRFCRRRNP